MLIPIFNIVGSGKKIKRKKHNTQKENIFHHFCSLKIYYKLFFKNLASSASGWACYSLMLGFLFFIKNTMGLCLQEEKNLIFSK